MKAEFVYIPFTVRDGEIETAKSAIREFIEHIRNEEPGTLFYTSLQEKEDPNKFAHFMVFADSESHEKHRSTDYVHAFVEKLYPVCSEEPNPISMEGFDMCGKAAYIIKAGKAL